MNAIIKGQFLKMDSYHSEKQGKDVPVLVLFDGRESIRVDGFKVPADKVYKMGDVMNVPVRIFNSQYGLRVSFDADAVI